MAEQTMQTSRIAFPSIGPNTYKNVGSAILSRELKVPTGDHTASLVYPAYCNPKKFSKLGSEEIKNIMKESSLWVFNRNFWGPKGVYVLQDLEAKGTDESLAEESLDINKLKRLLRTRFEVTLLGEPFATVSLLESKLENGKEISGIRFSKDNRLRFAPKKTYAFGDHTAESLIKDGFMIASYGKKGTEKLGGVCAKFEYQPHVFGIEVQKDFFLEQTVSTLCIRNNMFVISGVDSEKEKGCAFGVLK